MVNSIGLLDTSVVVDLGKIDVDLLPTEATISAVTLAELSVGPITATNAATRIQRQLLIQMTEATFSALPFDTQAARSYASLYAEVFSKGTKARGARALDLMIAATALAHQLPLYTRNAKDFAAIKNLVEIIAI